MRKLSVLMGIFGLAVAGLQAQSTAKQKDAVAKAFEHYEAIRVGLSTDEFKDVARHATELAPLAEKIGGAEAKKAADLLAAAKDLKTARDHFGPLSAALLPAFEKAGLKDVHFFTCAMVNQSWAQKGSEVQNPYMGKSMLSCGTPKK